MWPPMSFHIFGGENRLAKTILKVFKRRLIRHRENVASKGLFLVWQHTVIIWHEGIDAAIVVKWEDCHNVYRIVTKANIRVNLM